VLRVSFDPRIMTWNDEFTDAGRMKLGPRSRRHGGRPLHPRRGTTGAARARRERLSNFVASLGAGLFSVRQERRTYPMNAEFGITIASR